MSNKFDTITISSTTKNFEVVCTDFTILDGLGISHKKQHTVVTQKNSTSTREKDIFTNQPFNVEIYDEFKKLGRLQHEIELFDEQFIVTIESGTVKLFFYAKVDTHNLINLNNSGLVNYKINFLRTTFFVRAKNYQVDVEADAGVLNPYDYQYPIKYSGDISSYAESTKTVTNEGIKEAAVKFTFYDESPDGPQVGVGGHAETVFNSYISDGVTMADGDILINSNLYVPTIQKTTGAGVVTNEAQNRVFQNSRGYIYLPHGTSVLFFKFTKRVVITVYEFFENMRGTFL